MKHILLLSRTGAGFMTDVEIESDGSLTLLSQQSHGYLSAHRDYAAKHFDHKKLWRMSHQSWINLNGVRVVLTRWQPFTVWTGVNK